MKRLVLGVIAIAVASTPALAARFALQLSPAPRQTRVVGGLVSIDDTARGSSVRLVEARDGIGERGSLRLLVMNHGDRPFEFGPDNVTARLADGT